MGVLEDLFGSEVWKGPHPALDVDWSDEQLAPIVDRLQPYLINVKRRKARVAAAAVARTLVWHKNLTGTAVHFSRNPNHYQVPERYRTGGPYHTYRYVTQSVDLLVAAGLVDYEPGVWGQGGRGRQSVAKATDGLVDLIGDLVDVGVKPGVGRRTEVIVLRDANKNDVDYRDTPAILLMRAEVEDLNRHLADVRLYHDGQLLDSPQMRRILNQNPDRGARLYCRGRSYQIMPSAQRCELQQEIDGQLHPMVEVDFATIHITMAYSEADTPMPPGDHYRIDGLDRDLVKLAVNIMFNAANRKAAVRAIAEDIWTDERLSAATGLTSPTVHGYLGVAWGLVKAIEDKHTAIVDYFYSDCGARFQRRDSDIAIEVMQRVLRRTGRCPLPVHDSFLVADVDEVVLVEVMRVVAHRHHLPLHLKDSRGGRWEPLQA